MPLKIQDLQPGDRVILNCPKAKTATQREAEFEGIFASVEDAVRRGDRALLMGTTTADFLNAGNPWARFLMGVRGGLDVVGTFVVEDDGCLRDEEGHRIFIERRLGRVGVG